jgi:hypothetical protein
MAVPIKFTADFTDVRLAFSQLASQAARGIPLGIGGPGGFSSTNFGFSAGQASISATIGAGGQTGGGSFFGLSTNGLARYAGVGFLAREALRAGQAISELNDQTALAGGNQLGIYKAELGFQKTIGGIPVVGQAADLLSDAIATPIGYGRAGSEATIAEAAAQDAGAGARSAASAARIGLSARENISATTNPYERRIREADAAHEREMRQINDRQRAQEKADSEVIEKRRAKLEADHGGFINRHLPGYEDQVAADNTEIGSLRDQQAEARRRFDDDRRTEDLIYSRETGEIRRGQGFARAASDLGRAGSLRVSDLEVRGNTIAARREGLVNDNNMALLESAARHDDWNTSNNIYLAGNAKLAALDAADARAVRLGMTEARTGLDVTNALIEHNPLEARLKAIRGNTAAELQSPLAIFSSDYARLVKSGGQQAENLAIQDDRERRDLRDTALTNRGAYLQTLLRDDRYAGVAAQSLAIKDEAFLRVQELGLSNGGGRNNGAIRQVLSNSQTEQQLLVKNLIHTFTPQSISLNQTDLSGGGHGGDVQQTLADIAKNTADTAKKLDNLGKAL